MADRIFKPLTGQSVHLCVDMQLLFAPGGVWPTPWMEPVLPNVARIAGRHAERTIFSRFIPPQRPEDLPGTWQDYYRRWHAATRAEIDPELLDLMPPLRRLVPPAAVVDKQGFSAFHDSDLQQMLEEREADALVITGSETDVCVLSTVLSAVDRGWRVVIVTDAVCSSSDPGHDHLIDLYHRRYSQQIETIETDALLAVW